MSPSHFAQALARACVNNASRERSLPWAACMHKGIRSASYSVYDTRIFSTPSSLWEGGQTRAIHYTPKHATSARVQAAPAVRTANTVGGRLLNHFVGLLPILINIHIEVRATKGSSKHEHSVCHDLFAVVSKQTPPRPFAHKALLSTFVCAALRASVAARRVC